MKKHWFTSKSYGYGFAPITKEGWVSVFIFIGLLCLSAYVNNLFAIESELKYSLGFLFDVAVLSGVFTALFKDEVEGGLKWRWGALHSRTNCNILN